MGIFETTLEPCRICFRPILMTSSALILGVLPHRPYPPGHGVNSCQALGTAVIDGMLAAATLMIFPVPLFFIVVRKIFPGHPGRHDETDHD